MRSIGKQLLAGGLTLLCGVLLAGTAQALGARRADRGNGDSGQLALHQPSGNDAALAFGMSAFGPNPLGDGWKISERRSRNHLRIHDEVELTASLGTVSGFGGGGVPSSHFGHRGRYLGRNDPCKVVPEPGTFALLGGGLLGLGWLGRSRRS